MKKPVFFLKAFLAFSVAALLQSAQAQPVAGKDYVLVNPPQPVETGNKIEVRESFSYMCPHCYQFEPELSAWLKTLPSDVELRKLPVTFNRENWANAAKIYFALEATGEFTKLHGKVFDAIHGQKIDLSKPEVLFDWIGKQGSDQKKFADTYNSFTVQTKTTRLPQLTRAYGIDSVPMIVIDGKYRIVGGVSHQDQLRIASELIAIARAERGAKPAAEAGKKSDTK